MAGRKAEINNFRNATPRTQSATHSTSTGGDPLKLKKGGGAKQRAGKVGGMGRKN